MARSSFVTVVCTCTLTTHTRQWTDALDTNGATVQYSCHVVVPSIKHHSESKLSLISRTVVWLPHFFAYLLLPLSLASITSKNF